VGSARRKYTPEYRAEAVELVINSDRPLKKELIHLRVWAGLKAVRRAVFEYVEVYYNRKRIQKNLGYLTPSEYESGIDAGMAVAA